MDKKNEKSNNQQQFYPPVVSVLGHVDHGKTSLLDAIRKTDVVGREHGGITQKIGASSVEIIHEGTKRKITFIDTPGHEAFSAMRSRGAQVADIGLLIISSTDGIMPQTRESLKLLLQAKIPFIVVLTKADLPDKNPEKIKNQLLKEGIMLEEMGGDIPVIEVSAKTNKNVKELLDLILLVYEVSGLREKTATENDKFRSIVIESRLDQKSGPRATIVVKSGTLSLREELVSEGISVRVRTIIDDKGKNLDKVIVGDAVEILGFEKVPSVGSIVSKKGEEVLAEPVESPSLSQAVHQGRAIKNSIAATPVPEAYTSRLPAEETTTLSIIICTDTLGSLEAIIGMLPKGINIIAQKTGEIGAAEVMLAKSSKAIILGFNIKAKPDVLTLARTEKVLIKIYNIIYELIDEISDVLAGKKEALIEEILGKAKILASFPYEKTKVLGVVVLEGRAAKGDRVKLVRDETEIGQSHVSSVRQGKNTVTKVEKGEEAGIVLAPFLDFTIGDMLIFHR
ncbi:GTP-binding protein [Candidatus Microgenomates bacterium]|nr:MAG: GTP-binding protein [Candidatus Microgenomates bacterium]